MSINLAERGPSIYLMGLKKEGESPTGSKTKCLEIPSKTAHRGLQLKLRNYTPHTTAVHFTLYTVPYSLETQIAIEVDQLI